MKAADGTPIAERYAQRLELAKLYGGQILPYEYRHLAEELSASEERERDHAEEIERLRSFQLNYEHATKIERADFQQKIEMLQERERVLREALDDAGRWLSVWEPSPQPAAHRARAVLDAALATPAPEQPAQPKGKQ